MVCEHCGASYKEGLPADSCCEKRLLERLAEICAETGADLDEISGPLLELFRTAQALKRALP